jgi:aldehyde dehydrogenase (NAD+)
MNKIEQVEELRRRQLSFFSSGKTRDVKFICESLKKFEGSIVRHDSEIANALKEDLNKSSFETYATETGIVLHELRYQIRNFAKWKKPRRVRTPLYAMPSESFVAPEPLGRVFIISPWNYPFQLPLVPLVGAVAAGNVVVIRQSRFSPNTNAVIKKILNSSFAEEHVAIIDCDVECAEMIVKLRWDMIFFTGSTNVGRKIYSEAAQNLTPVILELGGKSPVIVDEDASISVAAKRIIWGKTLNSGQTCVAPDYLFVHAKIKEALLQEMISVIKKMFGEIPAENPDYPRIISQKAFDRLTGYIEQAKIIHGGRAKKDTLTIEPTLLEATFSDLCMREEIFGPVLPVITFNKLDEPIAFVNSREKALAVYFFSSDRKKQKRVQQETSSGAYLINDVILHIANKNLPYGGVGESGMGRYHGKESFRVFSNNKAVMKTSTKLDIPLKYPPFKKKEWLIRLFLR